MTPAHRDLSEAELWDRSLDRSRRRRALLPRARRELNRRKGLSAAAAAATMAGPGAPMAMAQVAGNVQADVAAETPSKRAIQVRAGGLPLQLGSQGALVAQVQRGLNVQADGIFGAQTDRAVRQYQVRAGLQVDGIVGPATWGSLFEAGSAVGASNVPPQVKQRIEQKLAAAGARVDTGSVAGAQGNDLFGGTDSADGTIGEETGPADGTTGAPVGGGDTGELPAGGQTEAPSAGGGQEPTTPVSGTCGSTVSSPVSGTVTSEYGPRWGRNHDGMDIAAPTGTAVRAAACGSVTIAGTQSGYGNIVCITHTSQMSTCYAHLSRFATSQGAQVRQGQVIGYVGCTGSCTGPHLHFETRVDGQAQNPRAYLNGAATPGRSASTAKAPAAVGPTTPTAPPGTPEAMIGETVPAEAAPVPTEAAPVPAEPVAVPTEAAPAPVEPAPIEATPVPVEPVAAPVPVDPAPVEPVAAPVPVEPAPVEPVAAPVPVEPVPVAPAEPVAAPAPVEPVAAPVPVEPVPVEPVAAPVPVEPVPVAPAEPVAAPAPVEATPVPAPAPVEVAPVPVEPAPVTDTTPATSASGGAPAQ